MTTSSDSAPGWDAISAAMARLYPEQVDPPVHMGTVVQSRVLFGGPEAIDGLSAYRAGGPTPHWHWITYGLTALYDKPEDEDPDWSGWGFELTLRAPVYPREVEASAWPMTILRGLGNHAHSTATVFEPERVIRLGGVKCSDDSPSQIAGFGFYADPELPLS